MKPGTKGNAESDRWPAWFRYLLYFLIVAGLAKSVSDGPGRLRAGERAAAFELANVSGAGQLRLSDHRGRAVLIEVFASWCSSCRATAPKIAKLALTHRSHVDFIGVSVDESAEQARATARAWDIPFPVALGDRAFSRNYGISTIPCVVLVDRNGAVVRTIHGIPNGDALDAWLTELGRSR